MLKRLYYCPEPGCGRWSILDISDRDNQYCVAHGAMKELKHPDRISVYTREEFEQEEQARVGGNTEAPLIIENCQPHEAIRALINRHWPRVHEEKQVSRDAQFAGFARLLNQEINDFTQNITYETYTSTSEVWRQVELIMARRAYDLVKHTIESIEHIDLDRLSSDEHISKIPDLTELPGEER